MKTSAEQDVSLFDVALPPRPYPGLRPFMQDEWAIFFGRERMCDGVVSRLLDAQLIVVHGDSGCGKSSLLRAGVLPRLDQEATCGGTRWRTCVATPGDAPLWNLADALAGVVDHEDREQARYQLRRLSNLGRDAIVPLAKYLRCGPKDQVCILIDQFEEVFAHARRHGAVEARMLIDLIIGIQREKLPGLCAMLTMRSEFIGTCGQFEGFAETVNDTQYLVPRIGHADLLRAIREPAGLYDGDISLDLAEQLIADAGSQDQLPFIQHGLTLLYSRHVSARKHTGPWKLTLKSYIPHTRGLGALLSEHADQVANAAAAAAGKSEPIERLFRALSDVNPDGQAIRRPQKLKDLVQVTDTDVETLLKILGFFRVDGVSFVRPYGDGPIADDDYIDISHEALLRCWTRVADPADGWLAREFKSGLIWRSLLVQADSFERDAANVLSHAMTDERQTWMRERSAAWAQRYGGGWERVERLIEASCEARDAHQKSELSNLIHEISHKRMKAELNRLRWGLFTLCFAGLLAWWLALDARESKLEAEDALSVAAKAKDEAERARTRAEDSLQLFRHSRDAEEDQRIAAEQSVREVDQALSQLLAASGATPSREILAQITSAQSALHNLKTILQAAAKATPRVFIHVSSSSQISAATEVKRLLEQAWSDRYVAIPGIQLSQSPSGADAIRCFTKADCGEAQQLRAALSKFLLSPQLEIQDVSEKYPEAPAGQYEIWFGQKELVLTQSSQPSLALLERFQLARAPKIQLEAQPVLPGSVKALPSEVKRTNGQVSVPLSATDRASSGSAFRVVAGAGRVETEANDNQVVKLPERGTIVLSSSDAQKIAAGSGLRVGVKTPLPWMIVDTKPRAEESGGAEVRTARPYLGLASAIHWDAEAKLHIAQFQLGIDAEAGEDGKLEDPMVATLSVTCRELLPARVALSQTGPAGETVVQVGCDAWTAKDPATQELRVRLDDAELPYKFSIPHRPGAPVLFPDATGASGLGVGLVQLTIKNVEEDQTPLVAARDLTFQLQTDGASIEPNDVEIPAGSTQATVGVRSRSLGRVTIRAMGDLRSDPVAINFEMPWSFLITTLLGGAAGGYLGSARTRHRRSKLVTAVVEGAICGVLIVFALLLLPGTGAIPDAARSSVIGWLLMSALSGFMSIELIERLTNRLFGSSREHALKKQI